ncbi:MAG: ATP-binding protein [Lachnospiraceae bacterium]|nr:ATP-binding protein [Lachnospiraceae bacterium]
MLLEFKTKNYKSFIEEVRFSMLAAPKQKGLDYSLCIEKIKGKVWKGLSSSIIYGPNAAGKTNIIGAMDVFRSIVLTGNIRNSEEKSSPNPASTALELIPNNKCTKSQPVEFAVEFIENGLRIGYNVSLDLGVFLDSEYQRKILKEEMTVNGELVFCRGDELTVENLKEIKPYITDALYKKADGLVEIAKNSLNQEELFLTNGFKLIFSQTFAKLVTDWFMNKFMIIYRADSMQLIKRFADPQKKAVYVEKTTDKAARLFGINSNAVGYVVGDEDSEAKLCSLFKDVNNGKAAAMAAELFESYGTIRFVNIFPLVIRAILTGGTLVVDEFDASIHPMALMSIINIFHNDDINIHHAQLIFNTHNPIFLNSNLFRRDEIKFVERNDDSYYSTLYALSDFGTSGDKGVRMHEDYMKNYFVSQYGAIKDIDFTPIFEEIIAAEGEV